MPENAETYYVINAKPYYLKEQQFVQNAAHANENTHRAQPEKTAASNQKLSKRAHRKDRPAGTRQTPSSSKSSAF